MGKPVKLTEEDVEELLAKRKLRVDGLWLRMEPETGSVREQFLQTAERVAERESLEAFVSDEAFRVQEKGSKDVWVHGVEMGESFWLVLRVHPKTETVEEREGFTPNVTEPYAQATFHEGPLSLDEGIDERAVAEAVYEWMFDGFDSTAEKLGRARFGGTMHNMEYQLDDVLAYY